MNLNALAVKKQASIVIKNPVSGTLNHKGFFCCLRYINSNTVVIIMVIVMERPYAASIFDDDWNASTITIPVSYTHLRAHETDSYLFVGSVRCVIRDRHK